MTGSPASSSLSSPGAMSSPARRRPASRTRTRLASSAAAFLVKVNPSTRSGRTRSLATSQTRRAAIVSLFPEPAPAMTAIGASGAPITAACSGVGSGMPSICASWPGLYRAVTAAPPDGERHQAAGRQAGRSSGFLTEDTAIQIWAAVSENVVPLRILLVCRQGEIAVSRQGQLSVTRLRAGERPAVRVDDHRPADPVHSSLGADPVADCYEHAVDSSGGLRTDHIHRPLAGRTRLGRPVRRNAQKLSAGQRGQPDPLGELQVVADEHRETRLRCLDYRRQAAARREDQLLRVPQVSLAVARAQARRIDDQRAVVQQAVVAELADAADNGDATLAG